MEQEIVSKLSSVTADDIQHAAQELLDEAPSSKGTIRSEIRRILLAFYYKYFVTKINVHSVIFRIALKIAKVSAAPLVMPTPAENNEYERIAKAYTFPQIKITYTLATDLIKEIQNAD